MISNIKYKKFCLESIANGSLIKPTEEQNAKFAEAVRKQNLAFENSKQNLV